MKIYAFLYNDNFYESSYATMSLHYSRLGAERAMKKHIREEKKKYNEIFSDSEGHNKNSYQDFKGWLVEEMKIYK
jgi:hypothetical protein